jgi:hypothetical protein
VHPVIAGEGRRLMEGIDLQARLSLKLVESKNATAENLFVEAS